MAENKKSGDLLAHLAIYSVAISLATYLFVHYRWIEERTFQIVAILLSATILSELIFALIPTQFNGKKIPIWLSILLIIASIGGIIPFGSSLLHNSSVSPGFAENIELSSDQEKKFIELFHALEVEEERGFNSNEVTYLDYIIQKYQLWDMSKLNKYQTEKELFSIDEEKWHQLLLSAQNYHINPGWKEEYKDIEQGTKDNYLKYMEQKDPASYKVWQALSEGNNAEIEKAYKQLNPDKEFPKKLWEKQLDKAFNEELRLRLREQFEREFF